MTVLVRPYRPDDFGPVNDLWRRSRLAAFPELQARKGYTAEQDREYFRDVVLVRHAVWVAERNGRAAGFMAIAGDFIDQLYVDPGDPRRGVGSALIAHARTLSPAGLRLFTFQANGPGRAFYETHGFVAGRFGVSAPPESEPDVEYRWARPRVSMPARVHVVGASGSGTTTLAAALAGRYGHRHLDTDDYYWLPTDPPYREPRPRAERLALLMGALAGVGRWTLSGSLCGWGDAVVSELDLVVFLVVPTVTRLTRLRARELERYGHEALAAGDAMRASHEAFLDWAGRYDGGPVDMRSRALHEAWLAALPCRVIRLEGDPPPADQLAGLEDRVAETERPA